MIDSEIKRRMKEAPEEGFRALFDEYWSYAYTIVYSILRGTGSRSDAEDCTADALSDVMMKYDTGHEGSLKAYVGTAARRKAIDMKRSLILHTGSNISLDGETVSEISSGEDVESSAEAADISRILLEKIEALGEPDASIIIQKYFFDRRSPEIARILGMNPITVRSRLRRALKRLEQSLSDMDITI